MDQIAPKTGPAGWLKWFVLFVVLLLVLGTAIWLLSGSSQIQRRIDAIRKAGYPVTAQDLERIYPPLPDDQNSAIIYEKVFSELPSLSTNMEGWPRLLHTSPPFHVHTTNLPPEVTQRISTFVGQNPSMFSLLHQAAAITNGRYAVDFTNGFSKASFTKNFIQVLEVCDCLGSAIMLHAEENKPEAMTESILDSYGLSRSLKNCPLISSQMAREYCLGLSGSAIELALNRTQLTDEELKRLYTATVEAGSFNGIKLALLFDRCSQIALYDEENSNLKRIPSLSIPFSLKLRVLLHQVFHNRDADYISYLDLMSEYVAASDLPYPQSVEISKRIYSNEIAKPTYNRFDIDVWHDRLLVDAGVHTQLLLAETALAIERYRLAHHDQLPGSLQQIVPAYLPAVPIDPFDGKPLRYNRLPKGYLLYSIGQDGVDNGGAEWNSDTETGDITFTVGR